MENQAFVFDGDDTLWLVEHLYDEARNAAARIVGSCGLDPIEWENIEREIDVENAKTFGMSRTRFPTSCVQAYREICRRYGKVAAISVEEAIVRAASVVFDAKAPLVADAREVLERLSAHGTLALITKGDSQVQRKRVADSGLAHLFALIEIVPEKSAFTFLRVLHCLGARPSDSWSVGNSYRSDILPAMEAGMRAIWVPAHVWEYERHGPDECDSSVCVAERLSLIPELVMRSLFERSD